jgi:hypothetical protein
MTKLLAAAMALTLMTGASALAQTAAPAAPAAAPASTPAAAPTKALSIDSTVKELLDNARTRAILTTHVPLIVEHAPEYPDIYPMTFRALAAMTEAQTMAGLTPEVLKKIEAEIAKPGEVK